MQETPRKYTQPTYTKDGLNGDLGYKERCRREGERKEENC